MRLAVYTDYAYHRIGEAIHAERAFALFLARLRPSFDSMLLIGRLSPPGGAARYEIGDVEFDALPYYPSLAQPLRAAPSLLRSLAIFWRRLPEIDCAWILGPHPLAIAFALLARVRGKRVVLGVRQDFPVYVRSRHPRRLDLRLAAQLLERSFRRLARLFPVVVVGPELARKYARARSLLPIAVSLVSLDDLTEVEQALRRDYSGTLTILSVGRIEEEKNPLLLADVLARLNEREQRWRLEVCGEGELAEPLRRRLEALGQERQARLLGYVPYGDELLRRYRDSHFLLHSSWTEGLPQVLLEAFASGLPVVASDVGGIGAAAGNAALLVPPGDAVAAAAAVARLQGDARLRERLIREGLARVGAHTIEAETRRLARFLRDAPSPGGRPET